MHSFIKNLGSLGTYRPHLCRVDGDKLRIRFHHEDDVDRGEYARFDFREIMLLV